MSLGLGFLLGGLVIVILGAVWVGTHNGWRKVEGTQIIFRQPLAERLLLGGFGLWLVLAPLELLTGRGADKAPLPLFFFAEPPLCLFGGMLFCAAGLHRELSLDSERRTDRFTSGWGLRPVIYTGGFADFGGVFVRSPSGRTKSEQYSVGLVWKSGRRRTPLLGMSGKQQEMDALAALMVSVLEAPLVSAPPPETLKDLLRPSSES